LSTSVRRRIGVVAALAVIAASGCSPPTERNPAPGLTQTSQEPVPVQSSGPGWTTRMVTISAPVEHVHAIVADADGSVLAGTHTGLYRIDAVGTATRIGSTRHDLMGLVRADDGTLLASGHPEPGSGLAEPLGLIASVDGGRSWQPRALQGQADFHSLTARGQHLAGVSSGPTAAWTLSLDTQTIWATGEEGLQRSDDDGKSFTSVADAPHLVLATAANDRTPWGVDLDGMVWVRSKKKWERVDTIGSAESIAAVDGDTAFVVQEHSLVVFDRR